VSATRGWVVGDGGTILRTTDGGSTWTAVSGTSSALRGLSFVNATAGWAGGRGGDGPEDRRRGAGWATQTVSPFAFLEAVSFVNERAGWIGGGGDLASTSDGGSTWTHFTTSFISFSGFEHTAFFTDARFVSEKRGVLVGYHRGGDVIFFTPDGGASWTIHQLNTAFARWQGAAFGDGSHFWAVGMKDSFDLFSPGQVAASVDGGAAWTMQDAPRRHARAQRRLVRQRDPRLGRRRERHGDPDHRRRRDRGYF
jgi:photosystem II stability/assembly factor-like uncharacterized protein